MKSENVYTICALEMELREAEGGQSEILTLFTRVTMGAEMGNFAVTGSTWKRGGGLG